MGTPLYSFRFAFLRFASLFRKRQLNHELSDEIESHLQFHIEENLCNGMSTGYSSTTSHSSPPSPSVLAPRSALHSLSSAFSA